MNFYNIVFASLYKSFSNEENWRTLSAALVFSFLQLLNLATLVSFLYIPTGIDFIEIIRSDLRLVGMISAFSLFALNVFYLMQGKRYRGIVEIHSSLPQKQRILYKYITMLYAAGTLILFFTIPLIAKSL